MNALDKLPRSTHRAAVLKAFGDLCHHDGRRIFDTPLCLVAFTNRCGSNYLCDMLTNTGHVGRIGEFLNGPTVRDISTKENIGSFPDYIRAIARRTTKPGGMFGLKASAQQIAMLYEFGILAMFPGVRVVHIYRNDVIAQAVSFSIASQTKRWKSIQGAANRQDREPVYDFADIQGRIRGLSASNQGIHEICALLELPKQDICYESLASDPGPDLRRTLSFLGAGETEPAPAQTTLERQATSRNEDFAARFRREVIAKHFRGR